MQSLVKMIVAGALFLGIQQATADVDHLNFNPTSIRGLAQAYGYILGLEFTLKRISNEYPDLSGQVLISKSKFNSSFPGIVKKLRVQIVAAMGDDFFKKTEANLRRQLATNLGNQEIDRGMALNFLGEVQKRSKGGIESPVLEYILSTQYLTHPSEEFSDGYRQEFRSEGHSKSQGLDLVLQLPKSWIAKEGRRPHIVQKWISQNGTGFEMVLLDIRDTEGYRPTNAEVEEFVLNGEIKEIVPAGANYMDSGIFSLEKRKGYWVEFGMVAERVGIELYQRIRLNQLFFRGKAIGLMCQTSRKSIERASADAAFKKITPLCQQVLNSFVFLQAY